MTDEEDDHRFMRSDWVDPTDRGGVEFDPLAAGDDLPAKKASSWPVAVVGGGVALAVLLMILL